MSLIRHILTALAYAVIAVAAALAAPRLRPPMSMEVGAVLAGVAFVGCALLHDLRGWRDRFGVLEHGVHGPRGHVSGGAEAGVIELQPARAIEVDDMMAELKVLQTVNGSPRHRPDHRQDRSEFAVRDPLGLNIDVGQGFLFGEPRELRS